MISLNNILRKSEYRISKSQTNYKLQIQNRSSDFRTIAPKIFISSRASVSSFASRWLEVSVTIEQSQPIAAFFGFAAASLYLHDKVFLSDRLVCLDVVCTYRSRGADKLLSVLNIRDRSRQLFHERATCLREVKCAVFKIVRFGFVGSAWLVLNFDIRICFGFGYSDFGFPIHI